MDMVYLGLMGGLLAVTVALVYGCSRLGNCK